MKLTKKHKLLGLIILLVLLAGLGYFLYSKGYFHKQTASSTNQDQKYSDQEVNQYNQYFKDAMAYMTSGQYQKAIDLYKKAAAIGRDKVWMPYEGMASAYRKMKDYIKADAAYTKALEISQYGEDSLYLQRVEMYRYDAKKSNDEIKQVYEMALAKVQSNASIIVSYAAFLRDIGDYQGALKYYNLLLTKFPNNNLYKEEIKNLNEKLKK